jgi:hypothetical protein
MHYRTGSTDFRWVLSRGKSECSQVGVLNEAAAQLCLHNDWLTSDDVEAVLIRSAISRANLRRDRVGRVRRVPHVEGCAGLHGVDRADLPSSQQRVHQSIAVVEKLGAMAYRQVIDQTGDVSDGQIVIGLPVVGGDVVGILGEGELPSSGRWRCRASATR